MKTLRNTLLGACVALPLFAAAGHAQPVQTQGIETQGRVIAVPPGAVVLILPGPGAVAMRTTPDAVAPARMTVMQAPVMQAPVMQLPLMRLIAQQDAAMQHMIADLNAMFAPIPNPAQLFGAAFGPGPMLTLARGPGVCSESVSIVQRGNSAPVVTRTASGTCGTAPAGRPESVRQLPPAPTRAPHGPKVLEISYPPHPVAPPRT